MYVKLFVKWVWPEASRRPLWLRKHGERRFARIPNVGDHVNLTDKDYPGDWSQISTVILYSDGSVELQIQAGGPTGTMSYLKHLFDLGFTVESVEKDLTRSERKELFPAFSVWEDALFGEDNLPKE